MKRLLLLPFVVLASSLASFAQGHIPNGGFEGWSTTVYYSDPTSYFTSNFQTLFGLGEAAVSEVNGVSGSAALMQTVTDGQDTIGGSIFNIVPGQSLFNGGAPYTGTPDSVRFTVAYDLSAGDTAIAGFVFNGGTLLGPILFVATFTGTDTSFHHETFDLPGFIGVPDSVVVIASSGDLDGPEDLGWLKIDEVHFIGTSQQLVNNGFDSWTDLATEDPDFWQTTNINSAIAGDTASVTKTTDAHSGSFALSLETIETEFFGDMGEVGFITNGDLFGDDGPEGGQLIDFRPEKFSFWYKYTPVGLDTALALAMFTRYNIDSARSDSINSTPLIQLPAASSYTMFEHVFDWSGTSEVPDTALVIFASSNFTDDSLTIVEVGSKLLVDDVIFEAAVGVLDVSNGLSVHVWPVPAADFLTISISSRRAINEGAIRLVDMLGRTVLIEHINFQRPHQDVLLDVSALSAGVYAWELELNGGRYSGKIEVQ